MKCFFVTDLHGDVGKYNRLFKQIHLERPDLVFLGGDLLAGGFVRGARNAEDTINYVLAAGFQTLREELRQLYPLVVIILGNDDPRSLISTFMTYEQEGLWIYANQRHFNYNGFSLLGYSWVPPTPFLNKDWERYDVSQYTDIGCVAPEEGYHSSFVSFSDLRHRTIWEDLLELTEGLDMSHSILLFHSPPYDTGLDRAALDGKMIDYAPLDVHVGSIAIRRFIEKTQPWITMHGHIHESYSITGVWKEQIGRTCCLSAAGLGKKLVLVSFDSDHPESATRTEL